MPPWRLINYTDHPWNFGLIHKTPMGWSVYFRGGFVLTWNIRDGQCILREICYKFQTSEEVIVISKTSRVLCVLKKNLRGGHCISPKKEWEKEDKKTQMKETPQINCIPTPIELLLFLVSFCDFFFNFSNSQSKNESKKQKILIKIWKRFTKSKVIDFRCTQNKNSNPTCAKIYHKWA